MNNKALKLYQRLYQIEELVGSIFVRISKSEIINLNYIDHLKLETNGMVHLTMKNYSTLFKRCVHWSYDFCHYFTYFSRDKYVPLYPDSFMGKIYYENFNEAVIMLICVALWALIGILFTYGNLIFTDTD